MRRLIQTVELARRAKFLSDRICPTNLKYLKYLLVIEPQSRSRCPYIPTNAQITIQTAKQSFPFVI